MFEVQNILDNGKYTINWKNSLDFYMEPKVIAVMDIETTGLKPEKELIVEIGICELNLSNGSTKKLFDSIVREPSFSELHKEVWIFQNSSLKFEDVFNAPLLDSYRTELQAIFDKYKITAYNKQFDFGFLTNRGFIFRNELDCPMMLNIPILKLPFPPRPVVNGFSPNFVRSGNEYKFPSVEESWKYYFPQEPYKETHRAYDDATHEARIVYEMYKKELFKIIW